MKRPTEPAADAPRSGVWSRREFAHTMGAAAISGVLVSCRDPRAGTGAPFDAVVVSDIMVPMRDGVRLATDIHLPARRGVAVDRRFPVILERTPYGKTRDSRSERSLAEPDRAKSRAEVARLFVERGFVVVYQDCRGRYGSEGEYRKYLDDANDGYDCCAWIVEQEWSNGSIGTMGLSYAAHTQAALASAGAPGIRAMFLDSGGFSNAYQGGIRQGGAFELKQATWAYNNGLVSPEVQANDSLRSAMEAEDVHQWFREMPWSPGRSPVSAAPEYEAYLFEQWREGNFSDYWKQPGIYAEGFHDVWPDAPMVHMSSWFDPYPRTATDNYRGLSKLKRGPVRLILGPWTHGNRSLTYAGDVDFGPNATLDGQLAKDHWELRIRWFDRWLRDVANGVDAEPTVRYFVMGGGSGRKNAAGRLDHGGHWRSADDWPIPGAVDTPFYLRVDGSLATDRPAAQDGSLTYTYDPRHPVPSIGGTITSGAPVMEGGAFDQREGPDFFGSRPPYPALADRSDVLAFQTPPLEKAVEVTGPISARLWIRSDAPDTDFTVKLVDVYPPNADYPNGYAMNITDGILRVRYRDSWESPSLMTPGEVYAIQVDAFPTSNLFAAGHRIRVDISSSNFPHFDLNFNTGEPEGMATGIRVARNTVFVDRTRPSHVILPIVPA